MKSLAKISPNSPRRHHYIPRFYLARWAIGSDGRLCQYSRPHFNIARNRKHTAATGFADKLYELAGLPDDISNAVETRFFSPLDSAASEALSLMELKGNWARWDSRRRLGWAMFLHSLLLRAPEDIAVFKEAWRRYMVSDEFGECDRRYQEIRGPDDLANFQEFMGSQSKDSHDRAAMSALVSIMDGGNVARFISEMLWHIIDTSEADFDLLTSDRPVIRSNGLKTEGGHLALPIGPRKLFVAARDEAALRAILNLSVRQLVRECNRQMCNYAVKYVYGVDDTQISFISKHFATKDQPRLSAAAFKNS